MNFKKSRNLMWMGFIAGILIIAIGMGFENETATCVFAFIGAIVFLHHSFRHLFFITALIVNIL